MSLAMVPKTCDMFRRVAIETNAVLRQFLLLNVYLQKQCVRRWQGKHAQLSGCVMHSNYQK